MSQMPEKEAAVLTLSVHIFSYLMSALPPAPLIKTDVGFWGNVHI